MAEKQVNVTGNKSTIYAWTCLFNCAAQANNVITQHLTSLHIYYGVYFCTRLLYQTRLL